MKMLASILFGTLFAIGVGLYSAQLVNSWLQQADHIIQVQP